MFIFENKTNMIMNCNVMKTLCVEDYGLACCTVLIFVNLSSDLRELILCDLTIWTDERGRRWSLSKLGLEMCRVFKGDNQCIVAHPEASWQPVQLLEQRVCPSISGCIHFCLGHWILCYCSCWIISRPSTTEPSKSMKSSATSIYPKICMCFNCLFIISLDKLSHVGL